MHKFELLSVIKTFKVSRRQFSVFLVSLCLFLGLSHFATAAAPSCVQAVSESKAPAVQNKNKAQFFQEVAKAIQSQQAEIRKILSRVNNVAGTELEFQLVKKLLTEELQLEIYNINNSRTLENAAVYGSTNVPLYTLIAHGVLIQSLAKNVWFRTPEITRQIYVDLLSTLKSALPEGTLDGIHLLTEGRDVQYDNFNKMYVMGLSKKGTRRERPPSELVVFTGNPATAKRLIEYNQSKIKEEVSKGGIAEPFRQVFLAFGAGINPMIIVKSARTQMDQVVRWSMEPAQINNGQDCMAPDFFAVDKQVEKEFVDKLLQESRALKPGSNQDPKAGYSALTMNKNFDQLINYREKYKKYLLNPEATFDPENKLVGPHVFVFPYSMFKSIDIREHFAPFYVVFSYGNSKQLQSMIRDERVQEKAMYATVLGGAGATPDLVNTVKMLKENRHNVIVNDTLFGDLHPNMPFGGKGASASMVVVTDFDPKIGIRSRVTHQPKLTSKEVFEAFGENQIKPLPPLTTPSESQVFIDNLVQKAVQPDHFEVENAQDRHRPTGLRFIQSIIRQIGLKILIDVEALSSGDKKKYQELYGTEVIHFPPGKKMRKVEGVVLHNSNFGEEARFLNSVRGDLNPQIGWKQLLSHLVDNKLAETHLVNAYSPGLMAKTETFEKLADNQLMSQKTLMLRSETRQMIEMLMAKKNLSSEQIQSLQDKVLNALESLFFDLRKQFPEGGYIKNFSEFGTADLGNQVTTFTTSTKKLAHSFVRRFLFARGSKESHFDSESFQRKILADAWDTDTSFVNQYLKDYRGLIVQSRVKIAQTPLGFPAEFRVDFIDGEPVHSRPRFSHEYLPDDLAAAEAVIRDFFKKLPPEFRYLPGGADVAKLQDGQWVIIEFNFGSASGTMSPEYFTFEYHQLISKLKGERTPWLSKMQSIFDSGIHSQMQFLKSLRHVRPVFFKAEGLDDLSVYEAGQYFRNLYLQKLDRQSDSTTQQFVLSQIRQLLEPWNDHQGIKELINGAESYVERL